MTRAAMARPEEKADVVMFYNNENEGKANGIRAALERMNLRVESYDSMKPGGYKFGSRASLVNNSWCIVLIVTPAFIENGLNKAETEMSLLQSIKNCLQKVVPVKCWSGDTLNGYPLMLDIINPIDGGMNSNEIANQISKTVEHLKGDANEMPSSSDPVEVELKEYQLRADTIIDEATKILVEHYKVDDKMKELHRNMQEEVNNIGWNAQDPESDDGCSCSQGELWKNKISDTKYWACEVKIYNNIKKSSNYRRNKHTADIHKLYQLKDKGYLKLARVFLFKKKKSKNPAWQCGNIMKYLDIDGILQLLMRCKGFGVTDGERKLIEEVHDARNDEAHIPLNLTSEEGQQEVERIADMVKDALSRLLSPEYHKLKKKIAQLRNAPLTVTIGPQSVVQPFRDLAIGDGSGAGRGDGGAAN